MSSRRFVEPTNITKTRRNSDAGVTTNLRHRYGYSAQVRWSNCAAGLSTVEYFTFGFGTMIGVGWLVLMDDWLSRGGPAGGMLGFLIGGLLLFPIAHTYGRLVQRIRDAGAEIAYTEGVFPPFTSFAAGWTMVLSYAIVCPWEAVATGNLLARVFPALNSYQLYAIGGSADLRAATRRRPGAHRADRRRQLPRHQAERRSFRT